MDKLISIINGANGALFICVSAILIVGLAVAIFFLFRWLIKNKNINFSKQNGLEIKDKEKTKQSPLSGEIKMSIKTFRDLIDAVESAYDPYIERREDIKNKFTAQMIEDQDNAISAAIGTLTLDYMNGSDDDTKDEREILQLYLKRDLFEVLGGELGKIRKDDSLAIYDDYDINNRISEITDNCIRRMNIKIQDYIIINTHIFQKIFESKISVLRDNIQNVIKKFKHSSKEEQRQIEEKLKDKNEKLSLRIKAIIHVDMEDI
jgi:hypothetical protein